jgi:hypothetical protein
LTLQDWLQLAAPSVELRIAAFLAIADALAHAHEQGLTHGCLQPAKVLVTAQQQVKLLDSALMLPLALEGSCSRPSAHAAPEHLAAQQPLRIDQYVLGLLPYLLPTVSPRTQRIYRWPNCIRVHMDMPACTGAHSAEQLRDTLTWWCSVVAARSRRATRCP